MRSWRLKGRHGRFGALATHAKLQKQTHCEDREQWSRGSARDHESHGFAYRKAAKQTHSHQRDLHKRSQIPEQRCGFLRGWWLSQAPSPSRHGPCSKPSQRPRRSCSPAKKRGRARCGDACSSTTGGAAPPGLTANRRANERRFAASRVFAKTKPISRGKSTTFFDEIVVD